jgi:hypothetical protein
MTNYTSGHETHRTGSKTWIHEAAVKYPENHIEVCYSLAHRLGPLFHEYHDRPVFFVHLVRDHYKTAQSHYKKFKIRKDYVEKQLTHPAGMAMGWWVMSGSPQKEDHQVAVCSDMVWTTNENIRHFLAPLPHMVIDIDDPLPAFDIFWNLIGAQGDRERARAEFGIRHNSMKDNLESKRRQLGRVE